MQSRQQSKTTEPERIVITGFGLQTPIGASFWNTALSLRAKRSCFQGHETVLVADTPSGAILRGATISRVPNAHIPRNLTGAHRAAALLVPPMTECLTGFPPELYQRLDWEIVTRHSECDEIILGSLAEKMPKANLSKVSLCQPGAIRSEFFARIAHAVEALQTNRSEYVVVACADSLCDSLQLTELLNAGLLKDAANPYGIMAGEAAGAILLERESTARRRGATILAGIAAWGSALEPHPWPSGSPSTAQGLTAAFHQAFAQLDDKGAGVGQVITDENGERPRSLEWALTAGRIFPNPEQERTLRHPAVIAGDAGGGLGAVLLADALARLLWRRPPRGRIVLALSDDEGERRTLCLEPVEQYQRRTMFTDIRQRLGLQKKTTEET